MAGAGSRKGKSRVFQKNSENRSRIGKQIQAAITRNAEKKYNITTLGTTSSAAAGAVWAVTQGIIQGDGVNTRDGSQIKILDIVNRITITLPTAATFGGLRCILFVDTMNVGSVPTVSNVLSTAAFTSPYSTEQMLTRRFRILCDTVVDLTAGGVQHKVLNIRRNLGHKIFYNATNDTAAANGKGALFLLFITDLIADFPTYAFSVTKSYLDL